MTQTGSSGGLSGRPYRKGTGRTLATSAQTALTLGAPGRHTGWTYGSSYPKDSYGFDSLDAVFGPVKPLPAPAHHSSSNNNKKQRTHPPQQQQQQGDDEDEDDNNVFQQLVRQFDAVPDEPEEGKDEHESEEEEEDEDEQGDDEEEEQDERMTNSPFFAASTPGRLSTASTATSSSASRLSRASLSPASPHTATRQLDLNDDAPEERDEKSDSKSGSKTRTGKRSLTRQPAEAETAAADDEQPGSAKREKRRSSGRVSFHVPDEQKEDEQKHDDEDEQPHAHTADDDDNDNDDEGGGADMHDDDDTRDSYDDTTTQNPTSPSAVSPIQPPPRPRRPRGAGGKRRETTRLIDEAMRLGIVKEQEEISLVSGRPKRNRTAPLEWWKGDKYEYAMEEDGIGNLMPIVKSVLRSGPTPEVKKKHKGRKAGTGKAHKRKQTRREPSESDGESDTEQSAFQSTGTASDKDDDTSERLALVHSPHHQQDIHKVVAKAEKALPLEFLAQPMSAGSIPATQLPKGGKAFEEREFSSGILLLPPRAIKQRELTHTVESFYVASAERGKLQVTIGETVLRLSRGDPFMVPVGNVYSLENLSERKEVKVYFHLIQSSEQLEKEVRQRMEEEHSGEKKRRRRRDEDDDNDEDDEEELN